VVNGQQKIIFAEMRAAGVRNVLIYYADHRGGHLNIVPDDADRWPDELRISDIEDHFGSSAELCARSATDTWFLRRNVRKRTLLAIELPVPSPLEAGALGG
jgi:hypothetical protein